MARLAEACFGSHSMSTESHNDSGQRPLDRPPAVAVVPIRPSIHTDSGWSVGRALRYPATYRLRNRPEGGDRCVTTPISFKTCKHVLNNSVFVRTCNLPDNFCQDTIRPTVASEGTTSGRPRSSCSIYALYGRRTACAGHDGYSVPFRRVVPAVRSRLRSCVGTVSGSPQSDSPAHSRRDRG